MVAARATTAARTVHDLDHLHPKDCVCGQPDCIPKLAGISDMARLPAQYSFTVFKLHCSARCVRLLHKGCQHAHTVRQWKEGVFAAIQRAVREEAAELAELGMTADDDEPEL